MARGGWDDERGLTRVTFERSDGARRDADAATRARERGGRGGGEAERAFCRARGVDRG